MDYRSCMKKIGIKSGKRNISGQNSQGCTGTPQQKPKCIDTGAGLYRYTPIRMQTVPVQVRGVPIHVCPKCPDCVVFA